MKDRIPQVGEACGIFLHISLLKNVQVYKK